MADASAPVIKAESLRSSVSGCRMNGAVEPEAPPDSVARRTAKQTRQ